MFSYESSDNLNSFDLKSIHISSLDNLEDSKQQNDANESVDYKKMSLNKLKSIVVEKNLSSQTDASKLKKNDILKLLGASE